MITDFDLEMLSKCDRIASEHSDDIHTKASAIICSGPNKELVISSQANKIPNGVNKTDDRLQRPQKYKWIEHAERNAIYAAAKLGISTKDSTMYLRWYPCVDCCRAIIQAGIIRLVCGKPDFDLPTWGEDFKIADIMLKESGVQVEYY